MTDEDDLLLGRQERAKRLISGIERDVWQMVRLLAIVEVSRDTDDWDRIGGCVSMLQTIAKMAETKADDARKAIEVFAKVWPYGGRT